MTSRRPDHLLFLLLFSLSTTLSAQFVSPLTVPLRVTGTFGELRGDHYHAGLDFRAPTGSPVRSAAAGYVSRVRATEGGYGQSVYVDHPDGLRTVYGHLDALAPALLDTLRRSQYARQTFTTDLRFGPEDFPVAAGQVIGAVGNRGYSFGSHLHFEIRETATDAAVNPMNYGFAIKDHRPPEIRALRVYELAADDAEERTVDLVPPAGGGPPDTIRVTTALVGIGLKTYDRQDAMPNRNGVYAVSLTSGTDTLFSLAYDRIPFEMTEYLNALTDYADWTANTSWFYRLWLLPDLRQRRGGLDFWAPTARYGTGRVRLRPGQSLPITVTATDRAGNASQVEVVLLRNETLAPANAPRKHTYYLPRGKESLIERPDFRFRIDSTALYRDAYLTYAKVPDGSDHRLSATHHIGNELIPLHGHAELAIRPDVALPDSLYEHAFLGRCGPETEASAYRSEWTPDGLLRARVGAFGAYALFLDTVPPTIEIDVFPADLRRRSGFSLLLDEPYGGSLDYRGTVNGKWILLEYDAKSGRLFHQFDDYSPIGAGEHELLLDVRDARGNRRRFRRHFRR